jgi:hypothetical protein
MSAKEQDPNAVWHEALTAWETTFNNLANQTMGSDEFSRAINQIKGPTLNAKEAFAAIIQNWLATMNMPSRQEVAGISERLRKVESQLQQLLQNPNNGDAGDKGKAATTQKPTRARRPAEQVPEAKIEPNSSVERGHDS